MELVFQNNSFFRASLISSGDPNIDSSTVLPEPPCSVSSLLALRFRLCNKNCTDKWFDNSDSAY